jgi:hypothetical protein
MIKRIMLVSILIIAGFGQSHFTNDLDGNPISFHGIIPDKTTYSQAYDHLRYVVGLEDLKLKEYKSGAKYLQGTNIMDTTPTMARVYTIDLNSDDQKNPTVKAVGTKTLFGPDDLINNLEAMASLFLSVADEIAAEYGNPTVTSSERYFRTWKFSSGIYESSYNLTVQSADTYVYLEEMFDGKHK